MQEQLQTLVWLVLIFDETEALLAKLGFTLKRRIESISIILY